MYLLSLHVVLIPLDDGQFVFAAPIQDTYFQVPYHMVFVTRHIARLRACKVFLPAGIRYLYSLGETVKNEDPKQP